MAVLLRFGAIPDQMMAEMEGRDMFRKIILAAAVLALAACAAPAADAPPDKAAPQSQTQSTPVPSKVYDPALEARLVADPAACKAANGEVRKVCLMGTPKCVISFKDAGKSCTDSSQCSGRCLGDQSVPMNQPATGKCAPTNDPCGCFQLVENGVAQPTLCAD